jgi:hypothetical protein
MEVAQAAGEAFSPQKRSSSTSKREIYSLFFPFLLVIFAHLHPDPGDHNQCRFGSATLEKTVRLQMT